MLSAEVQILSDKVPMRFYQQHFGIQGLEIWVHSEKCHQLGCFFHSWCGNANRQVLGVVLKFLFQPHYPTCTMLKMVTMEQLKKALLSNCLLECYVLT
jgi:hypothetical protein